MLTVKQNGGLLIVRDSDGRMVRKLNAVAAAKDWLKLGVLQEIRVPLPAARQHVGGSDEADGTMNNRPPDPAYRKISYDPCKPGAPPAWRRGAYGQGGEHGYIEHNQASAGRV